MTNKFCSSVSVQRFTRRPPSTHIQALVLLMLLTPHLSYFQVREWCVEQHSRGAGGKRTVLEVKWNTKTFSAVVADTTNNSFRASVLQAAPFICDNSSDSHREGMGQWGHTLVQINKSMKFVSIWREAELQFDADMQRKFYIVGIFLWGCRSLSK